ncbi:MAG TPA: ABC transporter substrate-binding protein [Acidimicrobiales bacterium]|nr:ABC transporter substrate-binding protein [Acidimicrobiales bacterium]
MRLRLLAVLAAGILVLAACGDDDTDTDDATDTTAAATDDGGDDVAAGTGNECTAGNTLVDGVLTPATGDPAFPPYVIDDDPASGQGFEAAVVAAVAEEMGFSPENINWVRVGFEEAIQPGPKDFDFNIQQYSITPERAEVVTFSEPYYTSNQAVVALEDSVAADAVTLEDLRGLKFGAQVATTSLAFAEDVIQPDQEVFVYNDNTAAKAALDAGQIDAIVLDLPTAFFVSAVEIEGSRVIAQFPAEAGGTTDQFGMLFELDNPLADCVNEALAALTESGELAEITEEWMSNVTDAPVVEVG